LLLSALSISRISIFPKWITMLLTVVWFEIVACLCSPYRTCLASLAVLVASWGENLASSRCNIYIGYIYE
jgi:hypothetical protein